MGARLTQTIPRPARCYSYSTEDFAALLPDCSLDQAKPLVTKLLQACSEKPFSDAGQSVSLTLSLGIASYRQHRPEDHEKFLFMAETALFNAKASGRDRAEVYVKTGFSGYNEEAKPLIFLKDKLSRILDKTRTSAITSLQHLAKSVAGTEHRRHAEQVTSYTDLLSEQMRLPAELQQTFQNSITLYTSFRFLLHNDLLTKPTSLTRDERQVIEDLPHKIRELTDMFDYFREERELLLCQGENYDGSGYPDGLKGGEIPIGSRILKIVDSLAAMNGDRPYRRRLTPEEIVRELYHGAGKQFDPFLVLQTLMIIGKHQLLEVDPEYLAKAQRDLSERVKDLLL
jgi:HD-GYP domain-containing protein (c-di-GMP phosphodiesterase class II)